MKKKDAAVANISKLLQQKTRIGKMGDWIKDISSLKHC